MPTATRDQIVLAVAIDLIKLILMSHNGILLPPLETDTREHLIDLANTFYRLLPKNNDMPLTSPLANNIKLPLELPSNTNSNIKKYSIVSPKVPLSRVQETKPSYPTAHAKPSITKK